MSDTDTDDTDLLLLIPPNYYTNTAERFLKQSNMNAAAEADALAMPPPASTTAAYQFLLPNKKMALNHINARLQNIEMEQQDERHFDTPSDISTISSSTVRTATETCKQGRQMHGVLHSTPKCGSGESPLQHRRAEDNILLEIDNYLDENNAWQHKSQHHSDDHLRLRAFSGQAHVSQSIGNSLPSLRLGASASIANDPKLMSLSDLWGNPNMAGTVIANNASALHKSPVLQEEQLRRQHLEKMVQTLQTQLLEYQQRISVAIEVDRAKDAALQQAEQQSKTLNFELQHMRDALHRVELERSDSHNKCDALQNELSQAVGLATKFQEKIEKLETELERKKKLATESTQNREQLELQLQGSKRAEEMSHAELNKFRDKFAKMDYQHDKLKKKNEDLEKENSTLREQKQMLQEYHQKQKARADNLETQRKSLQQALSNLTDIEMNLKKKLEIQQKSLKQHYQQQLESVVAKKIQEFQLQLDKSEGQLKAEARERERLIADRAVKQLEMINENNNLELSLMQEKHTEEVELYRLQLENASKTIEEMEVKLVNYKTKRAEIAQQLHSIMQVQWQQALDIITSPNQTTQLSGGETDNESPHLNNARHYPDTPKTSKTQRSSSNTEKNNLDVVGKKDPPSPMDKLQAYIELLLSKSPEDIAKLDQILALNNKLNGKQKQRNTIKPPPWKGP